MENTAIRKALCNLRKTTSMHDTSNALNVVFVQLVSRINDNDEDIQSLVIDLIETFSTLDLRVMPEIVTRYIKHQYPKDYDINGILPIGWSFVPRRNNLIGRLPRGYIIRGELAKMVFDESVRRGIYSDDGAWTPKPIEPYDLQSVIDHDDGSYWEKQLILPWPEKSRFMDILVAMMPE